MAEISSERIAELKARVKAECLRRCHIDSVESYGGEKYDFSRDPEKDNVAIEEHAEKILTPLNAINSAKFPSTRGDRVISDSELTTEEAFLTVAEARAVTDQYGTDCNGNCAGLCFGCTSGCVSGCTSCQGCSGTCKNTCKNACKETCYGFCSGCDTGCQGCSGCGSSCETGCSGCDGCSGCGSGCGSGCSRECVGCTGCRTTCGGDGCVAQCVTSCSAGCTTGCGSLCGSCHGSCTKVNYAD